MKLIVEMEKVPKNCDDSCWGYLSGECPWSDHVDGYTMNGSRPRNCPIKGILPEEHGDLVDYDEVEKEFNRLLTYMEEVPDENGIIWFRRETIMPRGYTMKFHTIIPAERKDDGTTAD